MYRKNFLRLTSFSIIFLITIQPLLALDTYVVVDDIVFVRTTPEEVLPQEELHGDEAYQNKGAGLYFFYGENIKGEYNPSTSTVIELKEKQLKHLDGSPGYGWFEENGYIDKSKLWKEPTLERIYSDRCMTLNNTPVYLLPDRKSKNVLQLYKGEVMDAIGRLEYNGENWIKVQTISLNAWNQDYDTIRYGYLPEKDATLLNYNEINESSISINEIPATIRNFGLTFSENDKKKLAQNGFYIEPEKYLTYWNIPGSYVDGRRAADDMADDYATIDSAVFITTDLYLHTTHVIFDRMLADTEEYKLYPEIKDMTLKLVEQSTQDLRSYAGTNKQIWNSLLYNVFFYSVAAKLLDSQFIIPVEVESDVKLMVSKIRNATGKEIPSLVNQIKLGEEDFSQYKVRGHYASKHVTREELYNQKYNNGISTSQNSPSIKEEKKPNIIVKSVNKIKNVFKGWFGKKENPNTSANQAQNTIQPIPIAAAQPASPSAIEEKDDSTALERYFRAMMWYGRHTHLLSDDEKTLSAILMVYQLEKSGEMPRWEKIDKVLNKLIAKTDDYTPVGYKQVVEKVYGSSTPSIKVIELGGNKSLQQFKAEVQKSLPSKKIVSMQTGIGKTQDNRLDMTAGFKFMGQRFTWDAYMFNQLSSPTIGSDADPRNIPSALDVMYILGSVAAKKEMGKDVSIHSWAEQYHSQISKIQNEAKDKLEKKETSYNTWLYGIKTLFQSGQSKQYFTQTEAWQYKNLNTALSSWTELKHDTTLYTEQSYSESGGEGPEPIPTYKPPYTKGYVEPNPLFFSVLVDLISDLKTDLSKNDMLTDEYKDKLTRLEELTKTAHNLAQKEITGEPITEDDYIWISRLRTNFDMSLLLPRNVGNSANEDLTQMALISDVATDAVFGQVLEVATGVPHRMFVVVKDAYGGTRITTGYVYSWYQFTDNKRWNDNEWKAKVYAGDKEIEKYKPSWYSKIER